MSDTDPPEIALLVEADADARTARALIDRQLRAAADWLLDADLDHHRGWRVIYWKNVRDMCKEHGLSKSHGRFDERRALDARAARRALILLSKLGPPAATVLLRDADNKPERHRGLAQGRADQHHKMDAGCIAIGLARPTREAWHLVGFIPETTTETEMLAAERERLDFDPTREPERLVRKGERAIKPILDRLTADSFDREQRCLECSSEHLRERGGGCGLTEFLDELDERVVPVFRGY